MSEPTEPMKDRKGYAIPFISLFSYGADKSAAHGQGYRAFFNALTVLVTILICAAIGMFGALNPVIIALLIAACFGAWVIGSVLQQPVNGFTIALWVFPWASFVRAVGMLYAPTLPLFLQRFWLEIVVACVAASIVLRKLIYGRNIMPGFAIVWEDLPIHLLMVAALYGLLLTLVQGQFFLAMFGIDISITPLLCYYLLRTLQLTRAQVGLILKALASGYILIAILSFYDYFFHPDLLLHIGMQARGIFDTDPEQMRLRFATSSFRMQSLMFHEDFWGAISGFLSTYALIRIFSKCATWRIYLLALLSTAGMMFAMARGSIIGWAVGMIVVIITLKGGRLRAVAALLTVATVIGGLYLQFQTDARIQYVEARISQVAPKQNALDSTGRISVQQNTYEGRTAAWSRAIGAFENQLSGFGLGTDGFAAEDAGKLDRYVSDGGFLRVAIEQGILGLLLFVFAMISIPVTIRGRLQNVADPLAHALGVCITAQTISLFVQAIAGNAFDYYYTTQVYFILFALFMELTAPRNRAENQAVNVAD